MSTSTRAAIAILTGLTVAIAGVLWVYFTPSIQAEFQSSGAVGDTIGGITGPILNFVGMIVVYFSLLEQLKANNAQNRAISEELRRSNEEVLLQSTENIIEAAQAAILAQVPTIRDIERKISGYEDELLGDTVIRKAGDLDMQMKQFENLDHHLLTSAALMTTAYERIIDRSFPIAYKVYVVDQFFNKCVVHLPKAYASPMTGDFMPDFTPNYMRLFEINGAFKTIYASVYGSALALPLSREWTTG
jgi:hypothetical protein